MPNYIINDKLEISNDLIVNGKIIKIVNKDGLNKVEDLDTYIPISGKVDELNADNLILCEFNVDCELIILGSSMFMDTIIYE